MLENKKNSTGKVKKIVNIVLNVIFYSLIVFIILFSISNLKVKTNLSIPSIFGKGYMTVLTESMDGDQKTSFNKNDLIMVNTINDKNRDKKTSKLEVGDIITFEYYVKELRSVQLVTHRIVDIVKVGDDVKYVTQGDKVVSQGHVYNTEPGGEQISAEYFQIIDQKDVVAIYSGQVKGLGKTVKFVTSPNGFLVCIVCPTVLFCIYRLVLMAISIITLKNTKQKEQNMADLEAEREKMKQELLAEMLKQQNNNQEGNNEE